MSDSLLRRQDVLALLNHLEREKVEFIDPSMEREKYRYPVVEQFVKSDVEVILEGLSGLGVLEKQLLDSIMVCPACESTSLMLKPVCPTCSSGRLMKGNVIEHMICGYVDFEQEFYSHGFKCIKCGKEMKTLGVDYRRAGVFFKCISCGRVTALPVRRYICVECGRANIEEELSLKPVFRYLVNREKFSALRGAFFDLTPLTSYIESMGYHVEAPAKIVGSSGVSHDFTLYINQTGQPTSSGLVADIVNEVSEDKIYEFFTKTFDVKAGAFMLLVVGKASEKAKKLASTFNIPLMEFASAEELIEKSKELVKATLSRLRKKELEREADIIEKLLQDLDKI
ncbi:MAG: hypothetical protein N3H84_00280 [Candidatus Caldarchaeum sp.]|nr:hypothetical protein [Candidatus Caldarchaeum sp.]